MAYRCEIDLSPGNSTTPLIIPPGETVRLLIVRF
jgi:hypothetical protein